MPQQNGIRYQDYVIKDGVFVGKFEEMYQSFDDPWEQSTRERNAADKILSIALMKKYKISKALEVGCGLGLYTHTLNANGIRTIGLDISETAVEKASRTYPGLVFEVGDVLDFDIYRRHNPDCIIMAQITWYILDKLDRLLDFLRQEFPHVLLVHQLVTYPPGVQRYGREKFTSLAEMVRYFRIPVLEYFEYGKENVHGEKRTVFFGRYAENRPDSADVPGRP